MHKYIHAKHKQCHEAIWLTQQVELGQLERQQTRKAGAALPKAEALLLATQQADRIYGKAFQEFTLQVQWLIHAQCVLSRGQYCLCHTCQQCLRWQCMEHYRSMSPLASAVPQIQ